MQKMIGFVAALALVATAMPASAEGSLFERNYNVLLQLVPAGGVIEVQMYDGAGNLVTQLWTAEQFAAFRAEKATLMGRDYTAGLQGAPGGAGDQQYVGDTWSDLWGSTSANVAAPRGAPRTVPIDDKLWIYGGAGSATGVFENANQCFVFFSFVICSSTYDWTVNQAGSEHGDSWHAGTGFFFLFGAPFGASLTYDGVALASDL